MLCVHIADHSFKESLSQSNDASTKGEGEGEGYL